MFQTVFFSMFWCSTVPEGQQGESSMQTVSGKRKRSFTERLVLFEELHSVGYWLIGGHDEMPGQALMSLNWTDN